MVVIEAKLPSGYIPEKSSVVEVRSPRCPRDPPCPTGTPSPGVLAPVGAPTEQLVPNLSRVPPAEEAGAGEEGGGAARPGDDLPGPGEMWHGDSGALCARAWGCFPMADGRASPLSCLRS